MNEAYRNYDPYSTSMEMFAVDAELSERLKFLRRVYIHVFAGILAMIGLEFLYFNTGIGPAIFSLFGRMWWVALIGFMGVCWFAQRLAFSGASAASQYTGLALYVVVESIFVAPAVAFALVKNPDLIGQAAFLTILITGALTAFVIFSKKDFSFLRTGLFVAGFGVFAVAIASMIFAFNVMLILSVAVIMLMCGYILYETSLIMKHLPTTAHVAGALMIFGSMAQLFKHLIYVLSILNDD